MTLGNFIDFMNTVAGENDLDKELSIVVHPEELRAGGTPTCGIQNVSFGFDWNAGKILIIPKKNLGVVES